MSNNFDNKEKAEENKYAREQETEFKIYARYHSLLAAWMAEKLKLDAGKKEAYKKSLVAAEIRKADDEKLYHKIQQELQAANVHLSEHDVRKKMHDLLRAATDEIKGKK